MSVADRAQGHLWRLAFLLRLVLSVNASDVLMCQLFICFVGSLQGTATTVT